jgi:pSer/pThr/pTyr-binding forkhead associated (FHA) protein
MKVRLVAVGQWLTEPQFVVKRFPAVVGRSPDAEVRVRDPWASRRHCELHQLDGGLVVQDTGSTHGTYVNGERVSVAHLQPGDRVTVGVTSFEVLYRRRRTGIRWGRRNKTPSPR